jgi:hypothetical protein
MNHKNGFMSIEILDWHRPLTPNNLQKQGNKDGNNLNNLEISPDILNTLRFFCLSLNFEELDTEFDNSFPENIYEE